MTMRSARRRLTKIRDSWCVHHLSQRKASYMLSGSSAIRKKKLSAGAIDIEEVYFTILLTSSAEPGSTEHAESWMLERE